MLLRAAFWIGLVALLMPHEPDLGFGRPGASVSAGEAMSALTSAVKAPGQLCDGRESLCAGGMIVAHSLQDAAVQRLARIKADIEEQQRLRVR